MSIMSMSTAPTTRASTNLTISMRTRFRRAASATAVGSAAASPPAPAPSAPAAPNTSVYPAPFTTLAISAGLTAPGR